MLYMNSASRWSTGNSPACAPEPGFNVAARVDVLADALGQLVDRVTLLALGHGIENVLLGTGHGVECSSAVAEHRGRVSLRNCTDRLVEVIERGLPRCQAVRQRQRGDERSADAQLALSDLRLNSSLVRYLQRYDRLRWACFGHTLAAPGGFGRRRPASPS